MEIKEIPLRIKISSTFIALWWRAGVEHKDSEHACSCVKGFEGVKSE